MLGLAAETARAARTAVDLAFQPAGLLPGSLNPPFVVSAAVDSGAAIDRVRGACRAIVAPLVTRSAAEHGLADWWGGPGT